MATAVGILTSLLLGASLLVLNEAGYLKYYRDHHANMECGTDEYISSIRSVFSYSRKGRLWSFECRAAENPLKDCSWSDYPSLYRAPFDFTCPPNQVITGIKTELCPFLPVRRFRFRCCDIEGKTLENCDMDFYSSNRMTGPLNLNLEPDRAISGVSSTYNAQFCDRIFNFTVCSITGNGFGGANSR